MMYSELIIYLHFSELTYVVCCDYSTVVRNNATDCGKFCHRRIARASTPSTIASDTGTKLIPIQSTWTTGDCSIAVSGWVSRRFREAAFPFPYFFTNLLVQASTHYSLIWSFADGGNYTVCAKRSR